MKEVHPLKLCDIAQRPDESTFDVNCRVGYRLFYDRQNVMTQVYFVVGRNSISE